MCPEDDRSVTWAIFGIGEAMTSGIQGQMSPYEEEGDDHGSVHILLLHGYS